MAGPHSAFANLLEMYKQKNSHEGEGWWRVNLPTGFEHSSSMSNNIHTSHQIMTQGRFEIYAKGLFSNDGVLRRALLGTWSAWGTLEDWGELEGCTLWRLLETPCSPGWQISTRNYIFSLSLSYALECPFLASYISTCNIDVSNQSKIIKGLDSFLSLSRLCTQLQSRLLLIFEDVPPIFIFLVLIFILTSTGGRLCINFRKQKLSIKGICLVWNSNFEPASTSGPVAIHQTARIQSPLKFIATQSLRE